MTTIGDRLHQTYSVRGRNMICLYACMYARVYVYVYECMHAYIKSRKHLEVGTLYIQYLQYEDVAENEDTHAHA